HQIQHDQMEQLATEYAVHLLGAFHSTHAIALLVEKALEQAPQARVVIDYEDLFAFAGGCSATHGSSRKNRQRIMRTQMTAQPKPLLADFSGAGRPAGPITRLARLFRPTLSPKLAGALIIPPLRAGSGLLG